MKKYIIKEEKQERIDKIFQELEKDLSRAMIQKLIKEGKILVNNNKTKSSYKLNKGDIITFIKPEIKETYLKKQDIDIEIVYEDKDILVINKQKGMCVHPGNGNKENTLVNAILGKCKQSLSGIGGEIRPGIVHRLDKDTSGLIIVAKNDKSHIELSKQFKEKKVEKTYITLVRGVVKEESAKIDMPIARNKKDRIKMAVDKDGKSAVTNFKVLKRYSGYTLLEVKIETGRTHQIRVHLSQIGYPVVGDEQYSNGKNPFRNKRSTITFTKN